MNINRINEVWAGLGKIVRLAEIGDEAAGTVRAHMVATLQQFGAQAGGGDYYEDFIRVVIPLETRVQPSIAALDRIRALARASAEAYVRVLATELGLSANAATAAILGAFAAQMVGASGMIAPSGAFATYFDENFAFTDFPTSESPTIPDEWVSHDVVVI